MANKKIIFFATCSMVATGFALASNVSLADKVGKFLSSTFQFEGPISGLVNALVRSQEEAGERPVISFQIPGKGQEAQTGSVAASAMLPPLGQLGAVSKAALNGGGAAAEMSVRKDIGTAAPTERGTALNAAGGEIVSVVKKQDARSLVGMGNADVTALLTDTSNIDNPSGVIKFSTVARQTTRAGSVEIPALATASARSEDQLLPANVGTTQIGTAGVTEPDEKNGATAAQINAQSVAPASTQATQASGVVPVPSSIVLLLAGVGLLTIARRKQ
jgi:hypothetical protein